MTRHERQRERRLLSDQIKNAGLINGTPVGIDDLRHIAWWDNNGPTDITNLVLLCPKYHKKVHRHGYTVIQDPAGRHRLIRPIRGSDDVFPRGPTPTIAA